MLAPNGVVNRTLLGIGLLDAPIPLSFNQGATVVGFVHFFVMLCTLTIFPSLVRIDPKLRFAAADLGASASSVRRSVWRCESVRPAKTAIPSGPCGWNNARFRAASCG